ncbi:ATP12 family protein [uncultured Shimia sp.]|uniref:ATP12 family chaperone protein n=1 Tax=uncultured Shimia sp. TaxID=573152 RepID=UPI00260A0D44|nr:ATP12 family protein [uncultured Shimia sp.]
MSGWAQKRFWTQAGIAEVDGGFAVELDGRRVKTPAKAPLTVPTRAMAEAIAAEWQAQGEKIDPTTMPVTRSANAAIDKVAHQHGEVADMLAEYGGSDLLCYRATGPVELVARQAEQWDPMLDWAEDALGARLKTVSGVMHEAQEIETLSHLSAQVHALNNFELAAFHDLVSLSGSLILGFAAVHAARPIEGLWTLSRLDETWQEEQWGADDEAAAQAEVKHQAFLHADRFFLLAQK